MPPSSRRGGTLVTRPAVQPVPLSTEHSARSARGPERRGGHAHTRIRRRLLLAARGVCKTSVLRRNGVRRGDWATPHRRASAAQSTACPRVRSPDESGVRTAVAPRARWRRTPRKKRGGIYGAISRRVRDDRRAFIYFFTVGCRVPRGTLRSRHRAATVAVSALPCLQAFTRPDARSRTTRTRGQLSAHGSAQSGASKSLVRSRETAKAPSRPALHQICCCWSW